MLRLVLIITIRVEQPINYKYREVRYERWPNTEGTGKMEYVCIFQAFALAENFTFTCIR